MPRWHTGGLRRWHQSPTVPPPCPHRIPSLPVSRPKVCRFGTVGGVGGTRERVGRAGFQNKRFKLTVRQVRRLAPAPAS